MGLSRLFILTCVAAVCALAAAEKPNVIIINADDLGFGKPQIRGQHARSNQGASMQLSPVLSCHPTTPLFR
jgi:arylsulfatase A-like enzyme